MKVILHVLAVSSCPSREEFPLIESEHKAHVRRLKGKMAKQERDRFILFLDFLQCF